MIRKWHRTRDEQSMVCLDWDRAACLGYVEHANGSFVATRVRWQRPVERAETRTPDEAQEFVERT